MHDYLIIDRSATPMPSSSIGSTSSVEDAITNIRSFLDAFKKYRGMEKKEVRL
jgi:hypothetical protein